MTTLSILVPTYCQAAYLEDCVISALTARLAPGNRIEVVILDDGSTDDTRDVGERLQRQAPEQVRYTWQPNTGHIPRNMNTLARQASGDLLLLFAGDDVFPQGWDAELRMARFANAPDLAFTLCQGGIITDTGSVTEHLRQPSDVIEVLAGSPSRSIVKDHLEKQPFQLFMQAAIIRRSVFDAVGGFDETLAADDTAMALRLFRWIMDQNMTHGVDLGVHFLYRTHGNNLHQNHLRGLKTKLEFYAAEIAPEYHVNFSKKLLYNLGGLSWSKLWSREVRKTLYAALDPNLARLLLLKASVRKLKRRTP